VRDDDQDRRLSLAVVGIFASALLLYLFALGMMLMFG